MNDSTAPSLSDKHGERLCARKDPSALSLHQKHPAQGSKIAILFTKEQGLDTADI